MPIEFHMIAGAPEPVATLSHATEIDGWVFITGQMPTVPGKPDAPLAAGVEAQAHQVMLNLGAVLGGLGLSFANVTMARAYLTRFERDYAAFNEERTAFFREEGLDPVPASTGIQAILCRPELLIEIEAIAMFRTVTQS